MKIRNVTTIVFHVMNKDNLYIFGQKLHLEEFKKIPGLSRTSLSIMLSRICIIWKKNIRIELPPYPTAMPKAKHLSIKNHLIVADSM